MGRFIMKHIDNRKPQIKISNVVKEEKKNNIKKNAKVMTTKEKIEMVKDVLSNETPQTTVKRVKRDKGLIERTESSKTILTEDNKELLND